jgi:glutamate synthase (NADPH/NADH) large chain
VLGPTGRNFAAGMSGGVAYVLDPLGVLSVRLNPAMVALEPLDEDDLAIVTGLAERHRAFTGSPVAARLLAAGAEGLAAVVKVMPHDYKRVLEATREAEAAGVPVEEAIMAASHG